MNIRYLAMVDLPFDDTSELRWGTLPLTELCGNQRGDPESAGLRIFLASRDQDLEEPVRKQLWAAAGELLRRRKILLRAIDKQGQAASGSYLFLCDASHHFTEVGHDESRVSRALSDPDATAGPAADPAEAAQSASKWLVEVAVENPAANPSAQLAAMLDNLARRHSIAGPNASLTPRNTSRSGAGRSTAVRGRSNADAIQAFKDMLLAQDWPDSKKVGERYGSEPGGAQAWASRARSEGSLFAVKAGTDSGGYRHPDFQFMEDGTPHPRIKELLKALGQRRDMSPDTDKRGWQRAFWFYTPRDELSELNLAIKRAEPDEVWSNPRKFEGISNVARTPADVFILDPQAVIDLAERDAKSIA